MQIYTMINKRIVFTAIATAVCTLLIGFIVLAHLGEYIAGDLTKQQLDMAIKSLDKQQARLGISCIDGDKALLNYIDAAALVSKKLRAGRRLSASDPIIELGEKTSDIVNTCGLANISLEAYGDHRLNKLALTEDKVREEFTVIRLSMTTSAASWCNTGCILDVQKKLEASILLLRQKAGSGLRY